MNDLVNPFSQNSSPQSFDQIRVTISANFENSAQF